MIDAGTSTYLMPCGEEAVGVRDSWGPADLGAVESGEVSGISAGRRRGPDRAVTLPAAASFSGTVSDDGLPPGGTLTTTWDTVSGPGTVTFADPRSADHHRPFSHPRHLPPPPHRRDGELTTSDTLTVTVTPPTPAAPWQ